MKQEAQPEIRSAAVGTKLTAKAETQAPTASELTPDVFRDLMKQYVESEKRNSELQKALERKECERQ